MQGSAGLQELADKHQLRAGWVRVLTRERLTEDIFARGGNQVLLKRRQGLELTEDLPDLGFKQCRFLNAIQKTEVVLNFGGDLLDDAFDLLSHTPHPTKNDRSLVFFLPSKTKAIDGEISGVDEVPGAMLVQSGVSDVLFFHEESGKREVEVVGLGLVVGGAGDVLGAGSEVYG